MKNIKTFEGFLDFFSKSDKKYDEAVLDKLKSGETVIIAYDEVGNYYFKFQLRSDGNSGTAVSDLPELKGMEFSINRDAKGYAFEKI